MTRILGRAIAALTLVLSACSGPPPTIPEIRVVNGTAYDLDVEVSDGNRQGWLPVGILEARSTEFSQDVIDQGDVWVFRFRHWGDPVGELTVTREELEEAGWRVEVPAEVSERLRELGRPLPP